MDLTELRRTIVSCKESITSATQDLTKLTGRNYDKSLDTNRQFSNTNVVSRENFINIQRLPTKRRISYENENQVEEKKSRTSKETPSLNSVVQMTRGRTRNDAIHDLKTLGNPKEKERCKRLFGHLMCTLNSIKVESEKATNDPQQITRLKIEKKVEEDHKLISETIQREQNELIRAKKDREFELKNLNQRYRAAEAFERWRVEKEKMKGFIRTSKPPYIFYKPAIINEEAQLRMDETAREIDSMIETRKNKLEIEIDRVVKRHQEIASGNKPMPYSEVGDISIDDKVIGSTVSVVVNNINGKDRGVSPAHSFASEDYDDMIEEIEITMHDEPVAITEDTDRTNVDIESSYSEVRLNDNNIEQIEKNPDETNLIIDKIGQDSEIGNDTMNLGVQIGDLTSLGVATEDQKIDVEGEYMDQVVMEVERNLTCEESVVTEIVNDSKEDQNIITDVLPISQV